MTKRNIGIAKQVLDGATVRDMAAETGLHPSRIAQIALAFCREYFLDHMLYDDNGKEKNLKGLRQAWRDILRV